MSAVATTGPVGRVWTWLGWRSRRIAEHRVDTAHGLANAEQTHAAAQLRAEAAGIMADWLARRSQQNHIAEALDEALRDPRR